MLLISFITIIAKIFATGTGALAAGQSLSTSVRSGFSMAQIGEFSFIIAGLGLTLQVTRPALFPIIIAVSAITTFTTPYLIMSSAALSKLLEKKLPSRARELLSHYTILIHRYLRLKKNGSYIVNILHVY